MDFELLYTNIEMSISFLFNNFKQRNKLFWLNLLFFLFIINLMVNLLSYNFLFAAMYGSMYCAEELVIVYILYVVMTFAIENFKNNYRLWLDYKFPFDFSFKFFSSLSFVYIVGLCGYYLQVNFLFYCMILSSVFAFDPAAFSIYLIINYICFIDLGLKLSAMLPVLIICSILILFPAIVPYSAYHNPKARYNNPDLIYLNKYPVYEIAALLLTLVITADHYWSFLTLVNLPIIFYSLFIVLFLVDRLLNLDKFKFTSFQKFAKSFSEEDIIMNNCFDQKLKSFCLENCYNYNFAKVYLEKNLHVLRDVHSRGFFS